MDIWHICILLAHRFSLIKCIIISIVCLSSFLYSSAFSNFMKHYMKGGILIVPDKKYCIWIIWELEKNYD